MIACGQLDESDIHWLMKKLHKKLELLYDRVQMIYVMMSAW